MRSKAHFKSHPLHPILIPFPIAFFTGTFLSHLAYLLFERTNLFSTAYYLNIGGIFFALLAAIPGLIDLTHTVPPKSSAKKRGVQHGLLNTCVVIMFTIAFFLRREEAPSHAIILALEIAGLTLMMIAGWMGGTLVYRNQIGVDHRYANAGKWNETTVSESSGLVEAAHSSELKINAMKLIHLPDKRIVLARTENGFVAFDDHCTHRGGSLAGGSIACGIVQCPWHGSQFDVRNGQVTAGPAKEGIHTYEVMEQHGKIFVRC